MSRNTKGRDTIGSSPLYESSPYDKEVLLDSKYDQNRIDKMYQFPAIYKQALIHKKANQFGYNSKYIEKKELSPLCACCELPINTMRIKMKYGTTPSAEKVKAGTHVFLLNSGSSMFFTFIKMAICYLLLRFLISDAYNLITSLMATYCIDHPKECSNFSSDISAYNKRTSSDESMVNIVDILNLVTVVISIVFFFFYRKYQFHIYNLVDISNHTQDDYTLLVENIPIFIAGEKNKDGKLEFSYENKLKEAFEGELGLWINQVISRKGEGSHFEKDFYQLAKNTPNFEKLPKVRSISLCFDLTEMEKITEIREKLMEEHIKNEQSKIDHGDESSLYYIPNQIKFLNQQYIELSKRFAMDDSAAFNLSHFVGRAFISFEYQHYREYFMREHKDYNHIQIDGKDLKLTSAAQPSDVYWFNMKIDSSERIKSTIYSYIILALSLGLSFGLLLGLQLYQIKQTPASLDGQLGAEPSTKDLILSYLFTLTMTILINAINFILSMVIQRLTESEKQKTKTDYITSLMIKNIIAQFLNTAIIYYILSIVNPQIKPLSQNGLIVKIMSLVAVSGVIQIAMNALQLGSLFSFLTNKVKYSEGKQINLFQVQLNKALQDPEFNFSERYAYYIMQVYVVSFYAMIAPALTLILALIFIVQYWVDKINLFQRFSCPIDFNYRLSRLTFKTFQISIAIFAIGNFIFSRQIHVTSQEAYQIINIVTLALAVGYSLFVLLMPKKWEDKLFSYESIQHQSYSQCMESYTFTKVYWTSNPGTSFAKEKDLNNPSKFVSYGEDDKIAEAQDYDEFINRQSKGKVEIEKYDAVFQKKIEQGLAAHFDATLILQEVNPTVNIS